MKTKSIIIVLFFLSCNSISSTKEIDYREKEVVNRVKLKDHILKYNSSINDKIDSLITAGDKRLKRDNNGKIIRPNDISPSGFPLYFETSHGDNLFSSIGAESVKSGGTLGLSLYGQGIVVGVWDYAAVLIEHEEFKDETGSTIIEINQNESQTVEDSHPTSVTSCIIAKGIFHDENYDFEGLAPNIDKLIYRDWDNRDIEVLINLDANSNFIVSNHSYGFPIKTSEGTFQYTANEIGVYGDRDKTLDLNANNYPYYLHVTSAGNEGDLEGYQEGTTIQYQGQEFAKYDLLTNGALAKNILTVGSISDQLTLFGTPSPSSFSSAGPADDGRIKPDIVARGERIPVASAFDSNNSISSTSRNLASGTSFSSPIVTGGLALLQELYKTYNGLFMHASSLKGLACHTADDVSSWNGYNNIVGPDAKTGFGVLNLEKAAALIMTNEANQLHIQELELNNEQVINVPIQMNQNTEPFIATICWNDPAKIDLSAAKDLIHDLDLRVTKNDITYFPWKLDPSNKNQPATKGDNQVDNIEKVEAGNEIGAYMVTISHKGQLESAQKFSLILSGSGIVLNNEKEFSHIKNKFIAFHDVLHNTISLKSLNADTNITAVSIYNLSGQLLFEKKNINDNHCTIESTHLDRGVYLLHVSSSIGYHTLKTVVY